MYARNVRTGHVGVIQPLPMPLLLGPFPLLVSPLLGKFPLLLVSPLLLDPLLLAPPNKTCIGGLLLGGM